MRHLARRLALPLVLAAAGLVTGPAPSFADDPTDIVTVPSVILVTPSGGQEVQTTDVGGCQLINAIQRTATRGGAGARTQDITYGAYIACEYAKRALDIHFTVYRRPHGSAVSWTAVDSARHTCQNCDSAGTPHSASYYEGSTIYDYRIASTFEVLFNTTRYGPWPANCTQVAYDKVECKDTTQATGY
jgi:hypothetical protein